MKLIPASLSRAVIQKGLMLQTHSPQLLLGAGVVSMISGTALACRATLKLDDVLSKAESDRDIAKVMAETQPDQYSAEDLKSDATRIMVRTTLEIGKLYLPAAALNLAGIAMLTKSYSILNTRNAALAAAYTAVDKAFREYRERTVEKYGEDVDRQLRYGTENVVIQHPGNRKDETIVRVGPGTPSQYARFFDQTCAPWSKDPEINLIWLRCQQSYLNEILISRGHVLLNEAYDTLGMERSEAGCVVGWMVDDNDVADNYIDFGVFKGDTPESIDFVNGREGAVLVDFNVDGLIFNKIGKKEALSWQRG